MRTTLKSTEMNKIFKKVHTLSVALGCWTKTFSGIVQTRKWAQGLTNKYTIIHISHFVGNLSVSLTTHRNFRPDKGSGSQWWVKTTNCVVDVKKRIITLSIYNLCIEKPCNLKLSQITVQGRVSMHKYFLWAT